MSITPATPAPTQLAGDLEAAAEALALVITTAGAAGEGATAFTRVAVTVPSKAEVDLLAGRWGVPARWSAARDMYVTHKYVGGGGVSAEVEAVYNVPAQAGTGAAA